MCDSDALMACNNWLALLIYIAITACVVLMLLLCFGLCRNYWMTRRSPSPYKFDSTMNSQLDPNDYADNAYLHHNPHAVMSSEPELQGHVNSGQQSEDFLPPYMPPKGGHQQRHTHQQQDSTSTTPSIATTRSTSSKPALNTSGSVSEQQISTLSVEYSSTV